MEHGEQLSHSSLPPHRSRCGSVEQPDEPVVEGRALGEQSLGWSRRSPQWWSLLLSSLTEVRRVVVEAQQLSHGGGALGHCAVEGTGEVAQGGTQRRGPR
jgi:hypothetical protein